MKRTTPLWQDEPYAARPPLDGDRSVDVAIVGAGIGGLSTALHLAEAGVSSTVVEARTAGSGASGRNGGFLIAGAAPGHRDAQVRFGPTLARRIHAATLAAQGRIYDLADEIGAGGLFIRDGILRVAMDAEEAADVRSEHAALAADGFAAELVEAEELPARLRRQDRIGMLTRNDAAMQPARWVRALAAALEERGVTLYEGTPAEPPARNGAGWVVRTPGGTLRAGRVVVAADGALPALVPAYAPRVRTLRLHMVATAPVAERILPRPIYARYGFEYAQQRPDGRLAVGGFRDAEGDACYTDREEPSALVQEHLRRYLAEELGVEAPITHGWVGLVGYTEDQRPFAGAVPGEDGLFALGGYCGTGNLNGFVAGRIVAELVAHGASADADLYDASR